MRGVWSMAAAALMLCCTPRSSGSAVPSGPVGLAAKAAPAVAPPPVETRPGPSEALGHVFAHAHEHTTGTAERPLLGEADVHGGGAPAAIHALQAPPVDHDPQISLLGWSDQRLAALIDEDVSKLGSVSAGKPNGGALLNGVALEADPRWEIVDPRRSFATEETLDYLRRAVAAVHEQFPEGTHAMFVGHLSRKEGGRLWPHRSHQSGRDVDLGYYYLPKYAEWYRPATPHTLDRPRTWAFVKALLTLTDVEYIFISTRVQMLLKEYALEIGEDPDWLNSVFEFRSRNPEPIIRHTYGHRTHMHVRFFNPKAQGVGIRTYDLLAKRRLISPRVRLQPYLARPGDSYAKLAKLAGHSARVLERTNRDEDLEAGRLIAVPIRGTVQRVESLEVPPRRRPPGEATTVTAVAGPADG